MSRARKPEASLVYEEVIYPESDGKPMAETDLHIDCLIDLREALKDFFRNDPDVYVSGNIFVYYKEGDPRKQVSPDVLVVKGVEKKRRRTYQIWSEGKTLDLVIEVTSRKTRREDTDFKKKLYQQLGVKEYYLFDPTGDYLKERLCGYRLIGNRYVAVRLPKGTDRLYSDVLGLELVLVMDQLRLYDRQSQRFLLTPDETAEAQRQAEEARRQADAARQRAEDAQHQEQLARQRAEDAQHQEQLARQQAQEEAARLRAELERVKKQLSLTTRPRHRTPSKKS
jgi:Uma2 family endonuclease